MGDPPEDNAWERVLPSFLEGELSEADAEFIEDLLTQAGYTVEEVNDDDIDDVIRRLNDTVFSRPNLQRLESIAEDLDESAELHRKIDKDD